MWIYAVALFGIAVTAEAVGLGGVPAKTLEIVNILFIVLLLAFVVTAFRKFSRH
jgi:uncharacterized membrane protein YtjA (UPF0391 family)